MSSLNDAQVYARQLLLKRHGYPLWVPEPYGNTVAYRTKGVRIGDVGYVTPEGGFETLFNVRAAPDDPINGRGVPEGFEQITIPPEDLVHLPHFHQPESVVTNASAKEKSCQLDLSTAGISGSPLSANMGARFTWNSEAGAILHLPDGASRLTSPPSLFRGSVMRGAKNWYKFVNFTLHRAVPNGSLYLITGCDKTRSWMVGSFSNSSSEAHASMKLNAAGMASGGLSYSYTWETSSPAVYRTGPPPSIDSPETIQSNAYPIHRDDTLFQFDAPNGQNQCIFLRGYRIMLRTTPLSHLLGSGSKVDVASISESHSKDVFAVSPKVPYDTGGCYQGSPGPGPGCDTDAFRLFDNEGAIDFDVALDIIPDLSQPYHPSDSINRYLLQMDPHIDVSVVHDDEWCCVLRKEDAQIPDEAELLSRFVEKHQLGNSAHLEDAVHSRDGLLGTNNTNPTAPSAPRNDTAPNSVGEVQLHVGRPNVLGITESGAGANVDVINRSERLHLNSVESQGGTRPARPHTSAYRDYYCTTLGGANMEISASSEPRFRYLPSMDDRPAPTNHQVQYIHVKTIGRKAMKRPRTAPEGGQCGLRTFHAIRKQRSLVF